MKFWAMFLGASLLASSAAFAADAELKAPPGTGAAPAVEDMVPRYAVIPGPTIDAEALTAQSNAGATVPFFNAKVTDHGQTFSYMMVGPNPQIGGANKTTTIPTVIIPIVAEFDNVTFDPTKNDSCAGDSALALTLGSPVFETITLKTGGVAVGKGQYIDLFQRANFWKFVKSKNPNFHVTLKVSAHKGKAVSFTGFPTQSAPCGNLGMVDFNTWDNFLQNTIFPQLGSAVGPTVFPFFLLTNVVFYQGTTSNCCILGYHSAFSNKGKLQTYGVGEFNSNGAFGDAVQDVSAISHEVGEWMDDPNGDNPTKPWGHIGQVSGCQANLEVGDALSGTTVPVTMHNGFTYHPQELVFFSWFYHQKPSIAVLPNYFSLFGTFKTPAAPCS